MSSIKKTKGIVADLMREAVQAARLYDGSLGACHVRDQERLYRRMTSRVSSIAKAADVTDTIASEAVASRARQLGPITPQPGKDY